MTKSYYTSLCRAWLDNEVLNRMSEKERIVELCSDERDIESLCEWIIDRLQSSDNGGNTERCLKDNIKEIDFIVVARALREQYVA